MTPLAGWPLYLEAHWMGLWRLIREHVYARQAKQGSTDDQMIMALVLLSLAEAPVCGKLPSGLFGANAAWWQIMILAFNVHSATKRLVPGESRANRRLKAIRSWLTDPTWPLACARQGAFCWTRWGGASVERCIL